MSQEQNGPYARRWIGRALRKSKEEMGAALVSELNTWPELIDYLTLTVAHHLEFTLKGSVYILGLQDYFFNSDRSVNEIVHGPFLKVFLSVSQCTEVEYEYIRALQRTFLWPAEEDVQTLPMREAPEALVDLINTNLTLLAGELQHYMLYGEGAGIPRLDSVKVTARSTQNLIKWRNENPVQAMEAQRAATKRAAELSEPSKFTVQIRQQLQAWYDEGKTYDDVLPLLESEFGVQTTRRSLTAMTDYYDLQYKAPLMLTDAVIGFYEENNNSVSAVMNHFVKKLGYDAFTIRAILRRSGLKTRFRADWRAVINPEVAPGESLETVLTNLIVQHGTKMEKSQLYTLFMADVRNLGFDQEIGFAAFKRKLVYLEDEIESK